MVQLARTQFGGLDILSPTATNYEEIEQILFGILSKGQDIRTAEEVKSYMEELEDDCVMQPLHQAGQPILMDSKYCALLWENPDNSGDPDYMAGIIFELVNDNGQNKFKPAGIIVGDEFEGVLQYRNGCCGGMTEEDKKSAYSMLVFVSQGGKINHQTLDTPVTRQGCLQQFEKLPRGITVSSHEIQHMLDHHHKGPEHKCCHDHSRLPKAKPA
jgi:hypothetical protein